MSQMPSLFTTIEINGRAYTLQSITQLDNGAQEWMVSRKGTGSMYVVTVAADGAFGAVRFLY